MSAANVPSDPPPAYDSLATSSTHPQSSSSHLEVPGQRNGIPAEHRRSMEDELRPLPTGWVRTFDPESGHQFFVNTTQDPPRSIWCHPYDDQDYLRTLSTEERERIEEESLRHPPDRVPSKVDIMDEHTDEEDHHVPADLPPRPDHSKSDGKKSLGRKMKDKITGSTHEEREQQRARRAEHEREIYAQHLRVRQAMTRALQTGQPQLLGKDRQGKDVYIQPPQYRGGYGSGMGAAHAYNPYGPGGLYASPNAMYMRPAMPYSRPYGRGYGGGYGMPLALGGGLLGGMMLGGALGGF